MRLILASRILIIFLLLVGCKKSYRTLEEGVWFNQELESNQLSIIERNDSLFLKFSKNEVYYIYESKYNDFIIVNKRKLPIWKEGKKIKFAKKTYIPEEMTLEPSFIGTWKNKETGLVIQNKNGPQWKIINDESEAIYYPKRTEKGYEITINGETIEFKNEGKYLIDSNGSKYFRTNY